KRGTIILQLKNELGYIAGQWGLVIETVEIRNVRVLSAQLFAHMQAPFRDKIRLESEISALATEERIAEQRLAQKEEAAQQEQEFQRRDLERRSEAMRLQTAADTQIQAFRLSQQRELVVLEQGVHAAQTTLETARERHRAQLAAIQDDTRRKQIETSNSEDRALALAKQLSAGLAALKVNELNLGDASLRSLALMLAGVLRRTKLDADA